MITIADQAYCHILSGFILTLFFLRLLACESGAV